MVKACVKARSLLLAVLFAAVPAIASSTMPSGDYFVREVIDGDTIVLDNGETVRYVGMDTPEINEPFYLEAKVRNVMLVQGRPVRVLVCGMEPRDRYGRVLAWVTSGGTPVNETLLKEGLAKVLTIPPCGLVRANAFKALEKEARDKKLGVWGAAARSAVRVISPLRRTCILARWCHERDDQESSNLAWDKLATGVGTLVLFMGVKNLPESRKTASRTAVRRKRRWR